MRITSIHLLLTLVTIIPTCIRTDPLFAFEICCKTFKEKIHFCLTLLPYIAKKRSLNKKKNTPIQSGDDSYSRS